jgi:hypothetical protein
MLQFEGKKCRITTPKREKNIVANSAPFHFNPFLPAALPVVLSFLERKAFQVVCLWI